VRSKFGTPVFEPKVFRKQMHCIEESICDFSAPGCCAPLLQAPAFCADGVNMGVTRGAQFHGRQFTMGALNHCWGAELLREAPKSPNTITSTFFNTVNLLPKELRFEHGGAKLASCPGRHLTSVHPRV